MGGCLRGVSAGGGVCRGVSAGGGVCRRGCLPGGCLPGGVDTPLWTESQTRVNTLLCHNFVAEVSNWILVISISNDNKQCRDVTSDAGLYGSRIFPRGVRNLPKLLLFFKFLPKTAWKWKNLDPRGGVPGAPLGSANEIYHKKTRMFPPNSIHPTIHLPNDPTIVFVFLFCIGLVESVELGEFK